MASRLDGHELEQAPGIGDGQGILVCCNPWDHKESVTTEQMKGTELSSSSYKTSTLCISVLPGQELPHTHTHTHTHTHSERGNKEFLLQAAAVQNCRQFLGWSQGPGGLYHFNSVT